MRAHKKVVILFRNPRGLDDRAMTPVMRTVDRRTKALVLTDHVDAVERYGKLVEDLGVSQTPSVVIIDRLGQGPADRGLRRLRHSHPSGRGRAMSEEPGGPALRAVPGGPAVAEDDAEEVGRASERALSRA